MYHKQTNHVPPPHQVRVVLTHADEEVMWAYNLMLQVASGIQCEYVKLVFKNGLDETK